MRTFRVKLSICAIAAAVSAFVAQGAAANTAYECAPTTSGPGFSDAHCKTAVSSGAAFKHVAIPTHTPKASTSTNVTTGTERSIFGIKSVQSGITLELQATGVEGTGTVENTEEGAAMWAQGSGTLTLTGVTVTAPAGKGCVVNTGTIKSNKLLSTTKGLTNEVKITPESGTFFAFTISGCSVAALNHAYEATGSLSGQTTGSTMTLVHAITTAIFSVQGQTAGVAGSITTRLGSNGMTFT